MARKTKKETPFATITIDLYENGRVVDIKGFKRVNERVLEGLPRFIREKLHILRAAAAREHKALERKEQAPAEALQEDVSTEEGESLPLPSSVEEIRAAITKEKSDG